MSSKTIDNSAYATSGYTLSGVFQAITVGASGSIGGPGLLGGGSEAYAIVNHGRVTGSVKGIYLQDGGSVTNSGSAAVIGGIDGVNIAFGAAYVNNAGTITGGNYNKYSGGTVAAGVLLSLGGTVHNTTSTGLIDGYYGVKIAGAGGLVANSGTIEGAAGVEIGGAAGSVDNSGTIETLGTGELAGVVLAKGGIVANSAGGLIAGYRGIEISGAGVVTNAGTIDAEGSRYHSIGIRITGGESTVINTGLIESVKGTERGAYGIYCSEGNVTNAASGVIDTGDYGIKVGTGTVVNLGHMSGSILAGVNSVVDNSGTVGGIIIRTGYSTPYVGVIDNRLGGLVTGFTAAGTVINAGTFMGAGRGVDRGTGVGELVRGDLVNKAGGLVESTYGDAAASFSLTNAGTIISTATSLATDRYGAVLATLLLNSANAVIEGYVGVRDYDSPTIAATLVNFGTIASSEGADGTAVEFDATDGTLFDEAGSRFIGNVISDGTNNHNTFALAGVSGTLSGLGTRFSGFATAEVLENADWAVVGANTIASGSAFIIENGATAAISGTLADEGLLADFDAGMTSISASVRETGAITIASTATLALNGADNLFTGGIDGAGTVEFDGGKSALTASSTLTAAHLALAGSATILDIGASLDYAGSFAETGGTLALPGAGETLTLSGGVTFDHGTIAGDGTLTGDFVQLDGGTVLAALSVDGGAVLRDYGTVTASGTLLFGSGRLVVEDKDVFDVTGNGGIAGKAGQVFNYWVFEKTGDGESVVASAFKNDAEILVTAGTLDLVGAVSGSGSATIGAGGTLEFAGAVAGTQTVSFASKAGGDLILDDPSGKSLGFAGKVRGFGSADELDLRSFAFSGKPTLTWKQDGGSGTLTVKDGADVAKIILFGQYAAGGFKLSGDGHLGSLIRYHAPTSQQAELAPPHR